ncbi:MAG: hypothetical protein U0744_09500 [Gemmataceae bacterium]
MRNIIFGGIGVVWGGGVVLYSLLSGSEVQIRNGAFAGGKIAGLALGVLLLIVGGFYLVQGFRSLGEEQDEPVRRTKKKKKAKRPADDEDDD